MATWMDLRTCAACKLKAIAGQETAHAVKVKVKAAGLSHVMFPEDRRGGSSLV